MSALLENLVRNLPAEFPAEDLNTPPKMWTLEEGVMFVHGLEHFMKDIGVHVGITGSVLYKGSSTKDLDIILYPHSTENIPDYEKIMDVLINKLGLIVKHGDIRDIPTYPASIRDISTYPSSSRPQKRVGQTGDQKKVGVWTTPDGTKRIDIFFLDFTPNDTKDVPL